MLMRKGVFRGILFEDIGSILDIGCGEASELSFIAKNHKKPDLIVGVDICPHRQKWQIYSKRQNNVNFIVASATNLPLKPDLFDFVFLKDVLHHISKNRMNVIREAYLVVRNLGILRVVEANRYHVNPILVFKRDNSHDHLTLKQIHSLQKHLRFDELYGFELLPSSSNLKKDILWNCFVHVFWLLTSWSIGIKSLLLYTRLKEKLLPSSLTYYVLNRKKR
jgi:SAM-dependent methyltransferase